MLDPQIDTAHRHVEGRSRVVVVLSADRSAGTRGAHCQRATGLRASLEYHQEPCGATG